MATKCTIYQDSNITPVFQPNPAHPGHGGVGMSSSSAHGGVGMSSSSAEIPKWQRNFPCYEYLKKQVGAIDTFMIYDGTCNRAPVWCDTNFQPRKPVRPFGTNGYADCGIDLDWDKGGGNFSSPPVEGPIKACARLAMDPTLYGGSGEQYLPISFDFENPTFVGIDVSQASERAKVSGHLHNAVKWVREANGYSPIWWYMYPPFLSGGNPNAVGFYDGHWKMQEELKDFSNYLGAAQPSFYHWDLAAMTNRGWIDMVDETTRALDKNFSHLPKIATVCPTWQIYWDQKYKHLNNTPVPGALWKKHMEYLVERDYDIYVWPGYAQMSEGTKYNLWSLSKMRR